jgi:RNA polymerase subunit RPABC4/transcription elongation factor Spt4
MQAGNGMFEEWLYIGIILVVGSVIGLYYIGQRQKEMLTPEDNCYICKCPIESTDEHVLYTLNLEGVGPMQKYLCKDCMQELLNAQDGVCPHCGEQLQWNGNLRQINNMWCHAKCAFEIESGKSAVTKEITKQVIIKVRCPYCNGTYAESLDRCPQCGAKHA